jgi:hypothetical protein
MSDATPQYRRIPGKKKCTGIGYYVLYEADDHLLQVNSRFGVEEYKRFYFADIQALVVRKTAEGLIKGLVLTGVTLLLALAATAWEWALSVFGIPASLVAMWLIVHVLRGPTCITTITTAVQTEQLHSLARLRKALEFMDRIRPAILGFQKSRPEPGAASRAGAVPGSARGPAGAGNERPGSVPPPAAAVRRRPPAGNGLPPGPDRRTASGRKP